MRDSESNFIIDNEIFGCEVYGLVISGGSWNVLRENNLTGNDLNLGVFGSYIHDIDASNLVDGKPVYYWVNQEDKIVPIDAGYVALINSKDIIVKNLSITHNQGILLANTTNSKIQDLNVSESLWGIHLLSSSNNLITGCTLTKNSHNIRMDESSQNNVTGNTFSYSWDDGIALYASNENIIWNNTITIDCLNSYSFMIDSAYQNVIYHNNIIHRYGHGVRFLTSGFNNWDNGVEGNYWSDYNGTDIDGNGIGDAPYKINSNNVDGYPLVNMLPNTPDTIPPVANAGNDKAEAVNVSVHFDASNSYDNVGIVSYEWDFGDGNTGTGLSINHTYSSIGNCTVTLTVRDAKNNIDSKSIIVQVLTDTDRDRIADRFDDDDDNDGLPDEWEIGNGLNPLDSSDANQDLDGDWFTNIEEYQWGMNPRIFNPWKIYFIVTITVSAIAISVTIIITLNLLRKKKSNPAILNETRKT
jgi:parallel beta-helix repeat protein